MMVSLVNASPQSNNMPARSRSIERHEMANLNGPRTPEHNVPDDDDNESIGGDEGGRALLGSSRQDRKWVSGVEQNTWYFVRDILVETAPTLLLTTVGLTFTGELLEQVADWKALQQVDELYILIPMLNNLKGNLEMNLSSRLSTAANIGELDWASTRKGLLLGNLSLLQVQALLVSAVAALLSFLLGLVVSPASSDLQAPGSIPKRRPPFRKPPVKADKSNPGVREFVMMLCTAMTSASISGFILGSFMCSLVLGCRRFQRNPDNITPPIASCLGDLLTLCIMGLVSSVFIRAIDTSLPFVALVLLAIGIVISILVTRRNEYVRQLITSGWTPLFGAMIISSGTGLVLDHFVNKYEGFGLLAVVISGLPGAVGSVFVSRLSTSLHSATSTSFHGNGSLKHDPRIRLTYITLFFVTLPVQLLFLTFLYITGWMQLPFLFIFIFIFFFCCAVLSSLAIAHLLTNFLWQRDLDPDTYAMPIQSSLVDLVGQLMLVACYEIAQSLGADVKDKSNI